MSKRDPDNPTRQSPGLDPRFNFEIGFTHLHERRDDWAVEEALQEQQVCIVGDFPQLLNVVTHVHERGWNSNDALIHNQLWIHRDWEWRIAACGIRVQWQQQSGEREKRD